MRLKSCPYCGRIHARGFDCGKLPVRGQQKDTAEHRFRHSERWKRMSIMIRERDKYMCVYCFKQLHKVTADTVEVHHIVPIKADYDMRLDADNLISLCREHHEAAEAGVISRDLLLSMAREQEEAYQSDHVCL